MANASHFIPAPRNSDEKPFRIGNTLTVFAAAMVYAGRHPHPRFLRNGSIEQHRQFLRAGIREREREREPPTRIRAQQCWDIYCELINRIKQHRLTPAKSAYLEDGEVDPRRTMIESADLVQLANERGEQPKYLKHLLRAVDDRASKRPLTKRKAETFTADYINSEKQEGKRPTMAGLERAAVKAGLRGGREYLRDDISSNAGHSGAWTSQKIIRQKIIRGEFAKSFGTGLCATISPRSPRNVEQAQCQLITLSLPTGKALC
jgi:hypothetical protein